LSHQKINFMRVFVTGATGFVGTAVVKELLAAGHQVLGLVRSDASAKKLTAAGATPHHGDLEDENSLKSGAKQADAVIHTGFIHDFTRFKEVCDVDSKAIDTIAAVLKGSNRPLLVTSGTAIVSPGNLAIETTIPPFHPEWPRASEIRAEAAAALGVKASSVRLAPSVHGEGDLHGFVPILINIARQKGVSAYVAEGGNRWNAVHRLDAAQLYRLAIEKGAGGVRYHAVGEEAINFKSIAEAIGKKLNIPVVSKSKEEAAEHFGWFARFAAIDCPASSKLTQEQLNWHPTHSTLLADIAGNVYIHS
jgi:nucleoside-diphosphate-sugar epimerase